MANVITGVRLVLIVPFGLLMASSVRGPSGAAIVFLTAIATDLLDGPVARHTRTTSTFGGTFDHTTDFLFVMSGLIAGATRSAFPWILPSVIAIAFAEYFIDSYWFHKQQGLRKSQLGRYNGILYFVPIGTDILGRLGFKFALTLLPFECWALVISTVASIAQRLISLRSAPPINPVPRGGERATQSSH